VESLTSALVGLVLTPLVVSTCGLEGLGMWAASWSLAHTTNLLDLGVGSSYTRFTSQSIALSDVARLNRTLAAGTGFHLAIATVVAPTVQEDKPAEEVVAETAAEPEVVGARGKKEEGEEEKDKDKDKKEKKDEKKEKGKA